MTNRRQLSPRQKELIKTYLEKAREFDAKFWREQQSFDERFGNKTSADQS